MNQYLDFYRQNRAAIEAASHPWLNAQREAAAAAFERMGLPTRKDEQSLYTDVQAAFAPNYGIRIAPDATNRPLSDAFRGGENTRGGFQSSIFNSQLLNDSLSALNLMLATDLNVIRIPAGEHKEHPIRISTIMRSAMPLMQNRRLVVIAEPGSFARILLNDKAADEQDFLITQVTEVVVGDGATLEFYDTEQLHGRCRRFHQLYADVAQDAHFTHAAFTLTGGLIRNTTRVRLGGEGAQADLLGCAVIDGNQHCDNNTLIEHAKPGGRSTELYKYVADGQATGAFAGRVLVQPGADRTDSRETSANLVCSTEARIYTQPMLEIYADDVKCSHGSTVGQLSDAALFYMRQRGINESDARLLLKQAFASDVIACLPYEPLRTRLQLLVDQRFRGELNHCRTCNLCATN